MSIRDIIEAATPHTCNGLSAANALFRDTFDPEHVALIEAERVAARELVDAVDEKDILRFDGARIRYTLARKATDAYRKERGL